LLERGGIKVPEREGFRREECMTRGKQREVKIEGGREGWRKRKGKGPLKMMKSHTMLYFRKNTTRERGRERGNRK